MPVDIPLFPLGSVLFPHMPMSLHIFEERYRRLMRDCEASGESFGVVAIESGRETGGRARPFMVGTLAQLREVERLDDGRYNLVISGATRFRVTGLSHDRPYLMASVDYLEEVQETAAELRPLAGNVVSVYRRYIASLQTIAGRGIGDIDVPDDPEMLSYLVAATLQIDTTQKQKLLETDSVAARLHGSLKLLRREVIFTDRMLVRRDPRLAAASLVPN